MFNAFTATFGYTPDDGTPEEFTQRKVVEHLRDVVFAYEVQQATAVAAQTAADAAADLATIT